LEQAAVLGRPEDDDVLAAPRPGRSATNRIVNRGERLGPGEGNDSCLSAGQHRFQLIVGKEAYRLAVGAPERIARAFRAAQRPRLERSQRSYPKRRTDLRVSNE